MKTLAYLASRHARLAILLIILFELTNACIGITVGGGLLAELSPLQLLSLIGVTFGIRSLILQFRSNQINHLTSTARFVFQKRIFISLFALNFWLYTLGGAVLSCMIQSPQSTASLYGSMTVVSTEQQRLSVVKKPGEKSEEKEGHTPNKGLMRLGYIGLFVVGVALGMISALLACNLACAGIGLGAVVVILLGIGILAGGFYFLGRAFDRNMKPFKEMTPEDKKREKRRYWRTALVTLLGIAVFVLASITV